jgi:hypothetical protein
VTPTLDLYPGFFITLLWFGLSRPQQSLDSPGFSSGTFFSTLRYFLVINTVYTLKGLLMPELEQLITSLQEQGYGVQLPDPNDGPPFICWLWRPWGIVAIGVSRTPLAAVKYVARQVEEGKTIPADFNLN